MDCYTAAKKALELLDPNGKLKNFVLDQAKTNPGKTVVKIAEYAETTPEVLALLYRCKSKRLHVAIATNPNTPMEIFEKIRKSNPRYKPLIEALYASPRIPKSEIPRLIKEANPNVLNGLAANPNVTDKQIDNTFSTIKDCWPNLLTRPHLKTGWLKGIITYGLDERYSRNYYERNKIEEPLLARTDLNEEVLLHLVKVNGERFQYGDKIKTLVQMPNFTFPVAIALLTAAKATGDRAMIRKRLLQHLPLAPWYTRTLEENLLAGADLSAES